MEASLFEISSWISGTVCGDGAIVIKGARDLAHAGPGDISFLENANNLKQPENCQASALIVSKGVVSLLPHLAVPTIVVSDPLRAFTEVFRRIRGLETGRSPGICVTASIHSSAKLGAECEIHPFVVIGANVTLGDRVTVHPHVTIGKGCQIANDVVLHPGVVLYPGMVLGNRVILHANVVVGADGFGYRLEEGKHKKVEQLGVVVLEEDVEIGAGTTIDRATFEETRIGRGTKVDNLVQIGHNCTLGEHNMIVSQVGIGGSTRTGEYVVIAGQAGLADHISIGKKVVIGARAGVMRDLPDGIMVLGAPARPEQEFKRMLVYMERLPDLIRQVKKLNQKIGMTEE
ncbi:MAG: UDP-3-O-(3-hydroxymyristoyl)glucosamine N-acyltransferase [Gemmataceae bacterium]|nr:UDP-3-O-(3-hydroxymyristoyl)glucosamine N-acyltransferase [Gemmataceae bacterium]